MRLFLSVIVVLLFVLGALSFSSFPCKANTFVSGSSLFQDDDIHFVVMKNDTGAWFFKILEDGKTIINQTHIPAIRGVVAFKDSTQAAKVAQLMSNKMAQGVFPPAISIQELDGLKIVY
jgi:hypothetical protein